MNSRTDTSSSRELIQSYARWRASPLGWITDGLERDLILELLGAVAGKRLLDVGCGDGALAAELVRRGARVVGLDADAGMIAAARERSAFRSGRLALVEGRAEKLPFAEAAFDGVIAVTLLCFAADAERTVAEMARVLKPGGRLAIGELGKWNAFAARRRIRAWLGSPTWRAAKFRTRRDLRAIVEVAGLDPVQIRGAVHYPPFAAAARLFAPLDAWLGRRSAPGAAFIAVSAVKSAGRMDFGKASGPMKGKLAG